MTVSFSPSSIANPQYILLFHHFRVLLKQARARGIEVAPLKGAHLLTSVYPEGYDRGTLSDVDFLVRPGDWEGILAVLRDMGFERRAPSNRPVSDREYHETAFYLDIGSDRRIMLEPHRYLAQRARLTVDYDALWRRSYRSTFDGVPCRRLAAPDHFLHLLVHLVSHSFIYARKYLSDLMMLIENGGVDPEHIVPEVDRWGVRRAAWLALSLIQPELPKRVLPRHIDVLSPSLPVRRYLSWLVPSREGFRYPGMGLRGQEAILWPALFDSLDAYVRYAGGYGLLRLRDALANYGKSSEGGR